MTELEQLRADLKTLEAAAEVAKKMACPNIAKGIDSVCMEAVRKEIAAIEAEKVEFWQGVKQIISDWEPLPYYDARWAVVKYVRHLEATIERDTLAYGTMVAQAANLLKERNDARAELAKLDEELRCERIDGGKVMDDLRAENERLKKKGPLYHPFRNATYRINILSHALEDMLDKHVPDWNEDTYHALLEKAQQDILDIPLSSEELEWYKTVDARNIVKPKTNAGHLREKLAELTTIANAIPPACTDAQALVQARINSVKKEMQGNE